MATTSRLIVLTVRSDSARLPGKALLSLGGKTVLEQIVERLQKVASCQVLVATTDRSEDDAIWNLIQSRHVPAWLGWRGDAEDVLKRVSSAVSSSNAKFILRATADCPFISWELVERAFRFVEQHNAETGRLWTAANSVPVYGAAEFPFTVEALGKLNQNTVGADREHVTADFDRNRLRYKVAYAVPPPIYQQTFYRPYRLELDTPEDYRFVQRVVEGVGAQASLAQVVRWLDAHPEVARINGGITEKTGPLSSYSSQERAGWVSQQSACSHEWRADWGWLQSGSPARLPENATPFFCDKGTCYLGYVLRGSDKVHRLYYPSVNNCDIEITGRVSLNCSCGAGREWYPDSKLRKS